MIFHCEKGLLLLNFMFPHTPFFASGGCRETSEEQHQNTSPPPPPLYLHNRKESNVLIASLQERPAILFIEHDFLAWGLPQLKSVSKHSTYPTDSVSCANLIWSFFGRSLEDQYNQIF